MLGATATARASAIARTTRHIGLICCVGLLVISGCGGGGASDSSLLQVSTPTLSASSTGGTFDEAQQITLSSNAPIYYTLDGSEPTSGSQRYNQALTLIDDTVLKAVAINGSGQSSPILTLNFTIDIAPPTISASSSGGSFDAAQTLTLTASTGASIHLTTDGTEPDANAAQYVEALTLVADVTVKAVAVDSYGQLSAVLTLDFAIDIPPPTIAISSNGGTFNEVQIVSFSTTDNAVIYFTEDGADPTDASSQYLEPLRLSTDITLSALAIDEYGGRSEILRASFVFDFAAPADFALAAASTVISTSNASAFPMSIVNGELDSSYRIETDDTSADTAAVVLTGQVSDAASLSVSANLSGLADGTISAVLTLTDAAGNASDPFTLALTKAAEMVDARVGGSVNISSGTQIDSDVNEASVTNTANNDFASAQDIFSPGLLGGYVNGSGTGPSGNLFSDGDEDYFRVSLSAGEKILLTIAESDADLDIELYDASQILVDDSLGTGNTETLTAPSTGDFYIRVFPYSGASNYVLSLSTAAISAAVQSNVNGWSSFDDFHTDHAVVTLGEKATGAMSALASSMRVVAGQQGSVPMLMAFSGGAARASTIASVNPKLAMQRAGLAANTLRKPKQETIWAIKALNRMAGGALAEPNFLRQPLAIPNDSLYPDQWHYPQIQLPQAWDVTTGDPDVVVAVIDSGILRNHPDFAGQLVAGADLISDSDNAGDGDGVDSDPEDAGDGGFGDGSSSFHGTHVAGTVAAATDNQIGVSGVAWSSRVMPIRTLGRNGGSSYDLIQSIRFAAGLTNASGLLPSRPADVINMSLGGGGFSQSEADAVAAARDAGVVVVAAAGNSGSSQLEYPASYAGVVSVAATNQGNALTGYSNSGSQVDVAAPGGDMGEDADADGFPDGVLSTIGSDRETTVSYGYRQYEGTSMAAPHVAGVVALMKAVHPSLTPAEFERVLEDGRITDDLGDTGRDDRFGHGLINAYKAVTTAQQLANGTLQPLPPQLRSSPTELNFGVTNTQITFTLRNAGGGDLTVSGVTNDASWLRVSAQSINAAGLGTYLASADRGDLIAGNYPAVIDLTSSAGSLQINAHLRVSSSVFSPSAGVLFALLTDPETGDSVLQQRMVSPQEGIYTLNFESVAPGSYGLVVGSDMDNDNFICDAGEACGAYPTLNDEQTIVITEDAVFALDISFDQSRFLHENASTSGHNPRRFQGYRYKNPSKTAR
ncbi:MAG: S8 family serine peptidase [Proteobacteria bacterium]|nr:S8 family serine peptidase [Pseudomonadota bacterium]